MKELSQHGKYADAIPLYQRALAIREKALGPDHPDVATALNNSGFAVRQPRAVTPTPSHSISGRGDPREGARPPTILMSHVAEQPGTALPEPGPLRRRGAALQASAGDPRKGHSVPTIPTLPRRSTIWLRSTRSKAATPTPSRSTSARWRSSKRRSVPTILMLRQR